MDAIPKSAVIGQVTYALAMLPKPHAWTLAILCDEDDAGRFEGGAHLVDTADASILAGLKTVDRIASNAGRFGKVEGAPIEGCTPHSALNWLHMVCLSPNSVDIKSGVTLPLMV
ncbi:hypothetical protein [Mesorhizobium sp. M0678]|uniref:hypothetical protein n=1 Tax=Mesorhizobium sp. M0678 TaxID=2956985 RepID=UPI00333CA701